MTLYLEQAGGEGIADEVASEAGVQCSGVYGGLVQWAYEEERCL